VLLDELIHFNHTHTLKDKTSKTVCKTAFQIDGDSYFLQVRPK